LLDTNIVIELFRGNQNVITMLEKQEKVYLPTATLRELYLGAYRSANVPKKFQEMKSFLESCTVLYTDATTIYKIETVVWLQKAKLIASDGSANDYLGVSVAMNDNYVVVGATGKNASIGLSYLFKRIGEAWRQALQHRLHPIFLE
jgi:predicted nucleic acid-binding protein